MNAISGGRAQPGDVGEDREHQERDEQRQVLDVGVGRGGADAHHGQHRLDADQLQRDVRHQGQDPGEGGRQREATGTVPAADEVGRGDVAVHPGDRPEPGQEDEDDRVDQDRVRHRVEPDGPGAEDQRGHRDERVGGVEVAAEQEPGDEHPEAAPAQTPLVEVHHVLRPPPARGREPGPGDDEEEDDDDRERGDVDVAHRVPPSSSPSRFCSSVASQSATEVTGMKMSRYQ